MDVIEERESRMKKIHDFYYYLEAQIRDLTSNNIMDFNLPKRIVCGSVGYNLFCKTLHFIYKPIGLYVGTPAYLTFSLFGFNLTIETSMQVPPNFIGIEFEGRGGLFTVPISYGNYTEKDIEFFAQILQENTTTQKL